MNTQKVVFVNKEPRIMKEMQKPYCVFTAENAWSEPASLRKESVRK